MRDSILVSSFNANDNNNEKKHIINILVTGSAGMIGGYVVRGLMEKGRSVVDVDRVLPRAESLEKRV